LGEVDLVAAAFISEGRAPMAEAAQMAGCAATRGITPITAPIAVLLGGVGERMGVLIRKPFRKMSM
jgi:hypothetical protein